MAPVTSIFRSNGHSAKGTVAKYAGAAGAAAPFVRRVMSDDELRHDLRTAIESAKKLYANIAQEQTAVLPRKLLSDSEIREQLDKAREALQDAGSRIKHDARPTTNWIPWVIVGGVAGVVATLFVLPQTSPRMRSMVSGLWSRSGGGQESMAV